jgi:hypothetical protein
VCVCVCVRVRVRVRLPIDPTTQPTIRNRASDLYQACIQH